MAGGKMRPDRMTPIGWLGIVLGVTGYPLAMLLIRFLS